jgi:hypothetical protein
MEEMAGILRGGEQHREKEMTTTRPWTSAADPERQEIVPSAVRCCGRIEPVAALLVEQVPPSQRLVARGTCKSMQGLGELPTAPRTGPVVLWLCR